MSKIMVLGVGAQGTATIMHLAKDPTVSELRLADINLERTKQTAKKIASDKISIQRVNAFKPDELLKAAKGVDVVVNIVAASKVINGKHMSPTLNVMDAAFKNGAHYIDVATAFRNEEEQMLKLSDKWRDAGLTAIFDLGKTPGITNVLARYAANRLDKVDKICIKTSLDVISKEFLLMWWPRYAVMGWMEPGLVYEDGKFRKVPPLSGEEIYEFPGDPLGPCPTYFSDHEEVWTLPRFIKGVRYVEFKHGSHRAPILKTLAQLFESDEPIKVKDVEVAPIDVLLAVIPPPAELPEKIEAGEVEDAYSCCVVDVEGEKAGVKTHYTLSCPIDLRQTKERLPGGTPESILVGTPPAVGATMLAKGEIKVKGVIPPECLNPDPFLANLAKKGVIVHEEVKRYLH
jgi:saccharopine dehydrogenase (NAD+, L-lysine-forming)